MAIALEIDARTAEKLRGLAAAQQISIDELLAAHIPGLATNGTNLNSSEARDRARDFEEWASDFPSDTPPLSDEAVGRGSIYRDR